jgi:hypothetical protein
MVADGREHLRTAVWLGRQDSNLGMAESKSDRSASHINEHFEKSSETVPNPVNMLARFSKWLGAPDHVGKGALCTLGLSGSTKMTAGQAGPLRTRGSVMTRKAKLTVEKLGAGADHIDVHTLHHRGMLTEMEKRSRQRVRDQVAHLAFGAETRMRSNARG